MTYLYQILADISKATNPDEFRKLMLEAIKHKEPYDGLTLTIKWPNGSISKVML